jgi:hypothetical protein
MSSATVKAAIDRRRAAFPVLAAVSLARPIECLDLDPAFSERLREHDCLAGNA